MSVKPPKVVFLCSHPIQYFAPLYRSLAASGRIELLVVYLSRHGLEERIDREFGATFKWDIDLLGGYRSTFLEHPRGDRSPGGFFSLSVRGLATLLERERARFLIVHGYQYLPMVVAPFVARRLGMKTLLRGESNLLQRRPAVKRLAKSALLGPFLRSFDACLYIGRHSHDYYAAYGVPKHKLFEAPYSVDGTAFERAARERAARRDGRVVIGFAGKLVQKKRPDLLVRACARLATTHDVALTLAGDGVLRRELERLAADLGFGGRLTITGFLNQSQMAEAYRDMDIFALPSRFEPWGLVVNEAMASGLPVVVSSAVGAAPDLVDGENGAVVSEDDVESWVAALRPFVEDAARRRLAGVRSSERIARRGIAATAGGILSALETLEKGT